MIYQAFCFLNDRLVYSIVGNRNNLSILKIFIITFYDYKQGDIQHIRYTFFHMLIIPGWLKKEIQVIRTWDVSSVFIWKRILQVLKMIHILVMSSWYIQLIWNTYILHHSMGFHLKFYYHLDFISEITIESWDLTIKFYGLAKQSTNCPNVKYDHAYTLI